MFTSKNINLYALTKTNPYELLEIHSLEIKQSSFMSYKRQKKYSFSNVFRLLKEVKLRANSELENSVPKRSPCPDPLVLVFR